MAVGCTRLFKGVRMNYFYFPQNATTPVFGPGVDRESFLQRKKLITDVFDKAVYLSVMDKIWRETSYVLQDHSHEGNQKLTVDSFWVGNKFVLDYVNSVYNLKEYLENYDHVNDYNSPIYAPINTAYSDTNSWFRFICEFRNCLIHHSGLIKDIDMKGKLWVSIDDFIDAEQEQLNHDISAKKSKRSTDERKRFISRLERISESSKASNGKGYQQAHIIAEKADIEIRNIMGSVYEILFNSKIQDSLKDLLSLMHHDESGYHATVFVEDEFSYEPCTDIESYLLYFAVNAGPDATITKKYADCLVNQGYSFLKTQNKTVQDFLENVRKRDY